MRGLLGSDRSMSWWVRWVAVLLAASLLAAACGGDGTDDDAGGGPAGAAADDDGHGEPSGDDASTEIPATIQIGEHWTREVVAQHTLETFYGVAVEVIDDELWLIGRSAGASKVLRHDGTAWVETVTGEGSVEAIATDGAGTMVMAGTRAKQAVIHTSTDGGATWRSFQPPSMATPADSELYLDGVVYRPGEFLAVGTVKGPDWHVRLWSSPDGQEWSLRSELRADGHPMSATTVLADDDQVVVIAREHGCSVPHINSSAGGWYLGSTWLHHLRVFQGSDASALALAGEDDHPLVAAPAELDCAVSTYELGQVPYPRATGAMVAGTISMIDDPWREDDDGSGQRIAQFVDGRWEYEELPDDLGGVTWRIVEVDGELALVRTLGTGAATLHLLMRGDDGTWEPVESGRQIANSVWDFAWHDGALVALVQIRAEPFNNIIDRAALYDVVLMRTVVDPDSTPRCDPGPGASCASVTADRLAGYPDLAGVDLSGADLTGADLGVGTYDGASFVGATLVGAISESGVVSFATFDGADFTGAFLQGAELGALDGAILSGVDASWGRLTFGQRAPVLDRAYLRSATVRMAAPVDAPDDLTVELSLAGADLTSARITGPYSDGHRLLIVDLAGATIDGTNFSDVDLTGLSLDGVDLSGASFNDGSLCPDGEPPVDRSCQG